MQGLFSLEGRCAIVTGGSRGLGLSMAEALGTAGARVVITARKEEQLKEAAAYLRQRQIECLELVGDLSGPETAEQLAAAAEERLGPVDILVNNAGITWGAAPESMPFDRWQKVLEVNINGTFVMSQAVGRRMLKRGRGSVINISSVAGIVGCDPAILDAIGYSTSKGAVNAFTRDLAVKWGPKGIRVNAIAPGFLPTKMTRHLFDTKADELIRRSALQRLGDPQDLWGPLLLLASDAGAHMTGQCLSVDGGMSCM